MISFSFRDISFLGTDATEVDEPPPETEVYPLGPNTDKKRGKDDTTDRARRGWGGWGGGGLVRLTYTHGLQGEVPLNRVWHFASQS